MTQSMFTNNKRIDNSILFNYYSINILLASNENVAKAIAKSLKSHEKDNIRYSICGIELEYGKKVVDEDNNFDVLLNHHLFAKNKKIPCLAFDEKRCNNFIISHIDSDTIFGIGWVSGYFSYHCNPEQIKILKEISKVLSEIDIKGFHNVDISKYKKQLSCINSFVSSVKDKIISMKNIDFTNISSIVINILSKIVETIFNAKKLNIKYNKIIDSMCDVKLNEEYSTNLVHVFDKKFNDFNKCVSHEFIIIKNYTISIFGRNSEIVRKYFPKGLVPFLNNFFSNSGGHFSAAGSARSKNVSNKDFEKFIKAFNDRIESVNKDKYGKLIN